MKPRFELVIRIVKDNPEKKDEEPKFRDVLFETSTGVMAEFNEGLPPGVTPDQLMAMNEMDLLRHTAGPVITAMQKLPLDTMVVQCMKGYQEKLARVAAAKIPFPPPAADAVPLPPAPAKSE